MVGFDTDERYDPNITLWNIFGVIAEPKNMTSLVYMTCCACAGRKQPRRLVQVAVRSLLLCLLQMRLEGHMLSSEARGQIDFLSLFQHSHILFTRSLPDSPPETAEKEAMEGVSLGA